MFSVAPAITEVIHLHPTSAPSSRTFSIFSNMYAQTLPSTKHVVYNPVANRGENLLFAPKLKPGFCNSAKRMFESRISLRNYSKFGGVRCGGGAQMEQEQEEQQDDSYYIRRCVELARTAIGYTSPNPMVGCVIVKDGKIVGEGFHPKAGQPHAEVFALRDAGDLAENGTAYVSLEPCNHYGRTPPCTEALIKAKVKKVVIGMVDPNAIVDSKGIRKLRDAGIEVTVGVEEELCKKLNEAYIHQMLTGKPFVTLRYSIAVNGHLLDQLGEEVTERGGYYSKLLQEHDAIILSSTSSFPASKEHGANQPLQIVLSRNPNSQIQTPNSTDDATSKAIIFTEKEMNVEPETSQKGIETVVFDRISLISVLEHCKHQGLCSVLLDLRGHYADFEDILREGFEQNLFQKWVVEVLPIWCGSEETALKHINVEKRVKNLTSMVSGKSILLVGYFE